MLNLLLPSRNLLDGSFRFTRRMKYADISYDRALCKRNSFPPFTGGTLARQCKIEPNTQIAYLWNNYNDPNTNTSVLNFLLFLFIDDASTCEIKQGWVIK